MINPEPLIIIMGAIITLLAVQKLLTRMGSRIDAQERVPAPPQQPPQRLELTTALSVTGLDDRGIEHLKKLIKEKEIAALTTFLAFNRPSVMELDLYLQLARTQLLASLPEAANKIPPKTLSALVAKYTPPPPPAKIQFASLSAEERQLILMFNPKSRYLITREFMSQFGGHSFISHFKHYCARDKSIALHVPPFDPDRKALETLAKSGIANKGRHIPLSQRLTVLKMSQLRQMAKDLNYDKKFNRKQEATEVLAIIPGAAVLLSMQYVVDDLFVLKPLNEDIQQVKAELAYLTAYAKLLISTSTKSTPHE